MSAPKVTFRMLQQRFVAGLARRLAQLNAEFTALGENEAAWMATSDAMMRGFHSLAGIGGTYGFPVITEISRTGELACAAMRTTPTPLELSKLKAILDSLEAASSEATAAVNSQLDQTQTAANSQETHVTA